MSIQKIKDNLRNIPDFPQEGILFKDITPILENHELFTATIDIFYEALKGFNPDVIVGIESRGFIFAAPLALRVNASFVLARKSGKLPYKKVSAGYALEYGKDSMEMHIDSIKENQKVIIIDDLLATGGTAKAAIELVKKLNGDILAVAFMIELAELNGRVKIDPIEVVTLIQD